MMRFFFAFFSLFIFSNSSILWGQKVFSLAQKNSKTSNVVVENAQRLSFECLALDNAWDYFKGELVQASEFYPVQKSLSCSLVRLPHYFEQSVYFSTYHCRLEGFLPRQRCAMNVYAKILSCCKIWCNRRFVGGAGFLANKKNLSKPAQTSQIVELLADENGVLDIVIQIENYELEKAGTVRIPVIAEKTLLEKKYLEQFFLSLMTASLLLVLTVYNFILLVQNKKSRLCFSQFLLCFFLMFAVLTTGLSFFNFVFPNFPFWIERRLSVLFLSFSVCACGFYLASAHRAQGKKAIVLCALSFANAASCILTPIRIFEKARLIFVICALFFLALFFVFSFGFLFEKNSNIRKSSFLFRKFNVIASALILTACFYDFVVAPQQTKLLHSFFAYKVAIFFFAITQCSLPAFRRQFANGKIQKSVRRFEQNNKVLAKFIPTAFLNFINAESATKNLVRDCRITYAMLLYIEIRFFKQLSESVEQKELFEIITEYYKQISPLIRKFDGYIAKHMRCGCLVVFPERSKKAILCALKIQKQMGEVRRVLRNKTSADISVGIAIHTGKIACGIIGSEKHLDCATFSLEMQTAIKIGMQTSKINSNILISEDAMAFCRACVECMFVGRFVLIDGKKTLVYSAILCKKPDDFVDDDAIENFGVGILEEINEE